MNIYDGGKYNVIVVGAGHAGVEAALACARLNKRTLLLTLNLDSIALLACNPAIGGTAKGHLVREIDALGGQMGQAIDETFIQIKMLNTGKGPAVHSLRAQADKKQYHTYMKRVIENTDNLDLTQAEVINIYTDGAGITGVLTSCGAKIKCDALVLATGVYLESKVIIGEYNAISGPSGFFGAYGLSGALRNLGLTLQRFKTGTPARVDRRSIDFSKVEPQYGDSSVQPFSFMTRNTAREQVPCYLTYTNEKTHDIIRANMHRSPLYSGVITGTGPRYCPSIEDKVVKFPDKERHQLFLEPESLSTNELYVQGMSSSMPLDVQLQIYRSVPGMENVHFMRPAYAIEYDCIDPTQLQASLELKEISGLFMAGQINGTSGYEEAAAQGLIAGINAVRYIEKNEPLTLGRDEAYAGVLIDDLITKGTSEPYRMMTSRAEYRLLLRQDNADSRLTQKGRDAGLVDDARYDRFMYKSQAMRQEIVRVQALNLPPSRELNEILARKEQPPVQASTGAASLLKRPLITYGDIAPLIDAPDLDEEIIGAVQTEIKYEGYIDKQKRQVDKFKSMENKKMPKDIDYMGITGLRIEARAKLTQIRPENLGQASRISGVSPSDIAVLAVYLKVGK